MNKKLMTLTTRTVSKGLALTLGIAFLAGTELQAVDLGAAKDYTLLQLGNPGPLGDGDLEVTSLSTVQGNVGKAFGNGGKKLRVSNRPSSTAGPTTQPE